MYERGKNETKPVACIGNEYWASSSTSLSHEDSKKRSRIGCLAAYSGFLTIQESSTAQITALTSCYCSKRCRQMYHRRRLPLDVHFADKAAF